jgi:hypothetical protein
MVVTMQSPQVDVASIGALPQGLLHHCEPVWWLILQGDLMSPSG